MLRAQHVPDSKKAFAPRSLGLALVLTSLFQVAHAGEAAIEFVSFERQGDAVWRVSVTLHHADSGWEHYADAWRVVLADGTVLGERTLYHPHVDEQPFTRSLPDIEIPAAETVVYVEAHDKVHGWAPTRVIVDLMTADGAAYSVRR